MKKTIVYLLCAAMLCAVLCGCGNQRQERDDMVVETPMVPETTPMVTQMPTPDPEDGFVKGEDGMIEDKDTGRDRSDKDEKEGGKTSVSPSPEVTSKP